MEQLKQADKKVFELESKNLTMTKNAQVYLRNWNHTSHVLSDLNFKYPKSHIRKYDEEVRIFPQETIDRGSNINNSVMIFYTIVSSF